MMPGLLQDSHGQGGDPPAQVFAEILDGLIAPESLKNTDKAAIITTIDQNMFKDNQKLQVPLAGPGSPDGPARHQGSLAPG